MRYHFKLWVGRTVGAYLISKFGHAVHITGEKVTHVQSWYDRVGKWGLLFGFYLPGVRHLIGFGAGIAKLPLSVFALFAFTGAFTMTSSIIIVSLFLLYIVGQQLLRQRK